eukprot:CAMPEP_0174940484 /NCGR_PEP_ID=MMETSP1355-20121228/69272_1 /TAXON_ID=464990 /ORGANISM="Hemiselmis tepida, Strain CCMP443" /LENGTH=78 /DNA_ID=CAMNT_0016187539 /DNA_START=31 /DNA_END=264 /DNA_ORIENTATION=+
MGAEDGGAQRVVVSERQSQGGVPVGVPHPHVGAKVEQDAEAAIVPVHAGIVRWRAARLVLGRQVAPPVVQDYPERVGV